MEVICCLKLDLQSVRLRRVTDRRTRHNCSPTTKPQLSISKDKAFLKGAARAWEGVEV